MIVESAPAGLRGELSKWMLEPRAGVFVGNISAAVRELLWEKACREVDEGGVTLIYSTNNEQGFSMRTYGDTSRQVEEWEGLFLVRRPNTPHAAAPETAGGSGLSGGTDWSAWEAMCYPAIWAKTDRFVTLAEGAPEWHPLICHMTDVAMVALRLWQYLLPPVVKEQMRTSLGVASLDEAGLWVAFFAGLHDLGKANPAFAFKWEKAADRLLAAGLKPPKFREGSPHGLITAYRLVDILPEQLGLDVESAAAIGHAIGGHHGLFPDPLQMEWIEERCGSTRWRKAQEQLAVVLAHILGVDQLTPPTGPRLTDTPFLMLLAGLTSVADWIGSHHQYFPFVGEKVYLPRYPRRARWLAMRALIDLGWFHRPAPAPEQPFSELFGFLPNRLQSELERVAAELHGPSLVLVEYPMGGGKTEGALYLASRLQAQAGQQGLYVALPTMATSNQMFRRVSAYLANRYPDTTINIQLVHGQADLNPDFARLLSRGKGETDLPSIEDETDPTGRLLAAEWFTNKKQALLAPFGIGTVDQILLAALDTKHFFVRLFGLAGKVVVVDEVHAYDTYMQSLLGHLLTWLAALGSSVILLSATLPSQTRRELIAAYAKGRGWTVSESDTTTYPRVTWLSQGELKSRAISGVPSRRIRLRHYTVADSAWMTVLRERLEAGGCAAVLCNTVERAQQTYLALRNWFSSDELLLFHARYPFDDRMEREQEVLRRFGKQGDERPFRMVCVATQVIEQSLDIDFDLMVSDLAPVDLILQRSGRVWRHDRTDRPAHLTEPELWLLMPPVSPEGLPQFDPGVARVYEPHLLLRSYLVLRDRPALEVPGGVEELIEAVYRMEPPPEEMPSALATYWKETADRLLAGDVRKQRKASISEIPPVDGDLLSWRPAALDDESEEIHEAHRAMTRLGGPAVQVVCVYERDGQVFLRPDADRPFPLERKPDGEATRALLGRTLRISFDPSLVKRILDLPVPPEWEATPHLRRHRLLRFAPDGTCLTAGLPLKLDPVLGLCKVSPEKEAAL